MQYPECIIYPLESRWNTYIKPLFIELEENGFSCSYEGGKIDLNVLNIDFSIDVDGEKLYFNFTEECDPGKCLVDIEGKKTSIITIPESINEKQNSKKIHKIINDNLTKKGVIVTIRQLI